MRDGDVWRAVVKRVEKTERVALDWGQLQAGRGPIDVVDHRLYTGAQRAWWDVCCERQLCARELLPYPETSLCGPYIGELVRRQETRPHLDHPHLLDRRPPLYVGAPIVGQQDLVYVDLEAAYFSIYTRTTLDVSYDGETGPVRGTLELLDADELGKHKLARNALLGMQRRRRRRGLDHGQRFSEIVPAHRRRPDLWGLVMDALEVVMWTARDLGCVYIHTDGAIFTSHDTALGWIDLLSTRFGLAATVRARGPGLVWGLGRWQIGDQTHGPDEPGSPVDSMVPTPENLRHILTAWLSGTSMLASDRVQEATT
ncbi:MAG: hypothetical protein ACYCV4_02570 [Dermatophilaceae bacterium]